MKCLKWLVLLGSYAIGSAQTINITGMVVDSATSLGINSALVRLVEIPQCSTRTNATGAFALTYTATTSTPFSIRSAEGIFLERNTLAISGAGPSALIAVDVYDCNGKRVFHAQRIAGTAPKVVFSGLWQRPGLYLVTVGINSKKFSFPNKGLGCFSIEPTQETAAGLCKKSATYTVAVSAVGYVGKQVSMSSGTGSAGTIRLVAASARPNPSYAAYLIGNTGDGTGGYRYDNATYQAYAKLLRWHIMNPLVNHDQAAAQTLKTICSNIRASSIGTKSVFYFDPFFIESYYETNFLNAFTSSNWFLRATFPSGAVVHPGGNTNSFVGNLTPGGPTGPGGRTADQYVADYEVDERINGGSLGLSSERVAANPYVDGFFHDDLQPGANFTGGASVSGDFQRIDSANDFAYPNGAANVGMRTGSIAIMDRIKANAPYPVIVGGNGGGIPWLSTLAVPPEFVGRWDLIIYENAQGGGSGSPSNPGNGGSFETMLTIYQKHAQTLKTTGAVYAQFIGNNVRADGSAMVSYNVGTSGPPVWSPAWQGVRYQWGLCNVLGDFDYFCCATDPFNSGGQGTPYACGAGFLRWFDWFQCNPTTHVAYNQANENLGSNWLGAAIDPAQTVKWQAIGSKGIWRRRFANADIFVNPYGNGAQANVNLGAAYHFPVSAQDPLYNGAAFSSYSFGDGDCIVGFTN